MTELAPITDVGDAWTNSQSSPKDRRSTNYGDSVWVQVKSGERRGWLRMSLPAIEGRTVLDAYLVGHAGPGFVAQTITATAVAERWRPGDITHSSRPALRSTAVSSAITSKTDGAVVTVSGLGPMLQAVADGTEWWGVQLTTSSTADGQMFYATESGQPAWELHITLSELSEAPSDLRPSGGGAVGTRRPILAWAADGQVARRIQVDTPALGVEPDEVSPDFDTTMQASTDQTFNLATSSHTPAGTNPVFWRVLVEREGDDTDPEWSDWASFDNVALSGLVVDSPTGPFGDVTPLVAAHLASGSLSSWKAMITGPSRADVRHRVDLSTGPISFTPPETIKGEGRRVVENGGWIYIEAADNVDRAVAVGESTTSSVWIPIVLADSGTVAAPTALSVVQVAPGDPRHVWSWSRTVAAEAWLFSVGNRDVARVPAAEVSVISGRYTWTDNGEIPPMRPADLKVRALEGDLRSAPAVVSNHVHQVQGFCWLPANLEGRGVGAEPIVLQGTPVRDFANVGRYATYEVMKGPTIDIVTDPNPGMTGIFNGSVSTAYGTDVWATLDAVEDLRNSQTRLARQVWGSRSILVRVADPDSVPDDEILPSNLIHRVSGRFVQVGD